MGNCERYPDDPELYEVEEALNNVYVVPESCDDICLLGNWIKRIVNKGVEIAL
jgi:hypothetical protein